MDSVNWTDLMKTAAEASNEGITPGTYLVEAETCELKTASSGNQMFVVKFRFIGGAVDGKKLIRNFVISPGSPVGLNMFFRQMAAMRVPKEFLAAGPAPDQIAQRVIGSRVNAKVKMGKWQGEDRPEIDSVSALPGGGASVPPVPGMPAPSVAPVPTMSAPPSFPDGV